MFRKILKILKNSYVLITIVFIVWVLFFDKNNLISQIGLAKKLHKLKEDKDYYQKSIKDDSLKMHELQTDPVNLEKFAREKHIMKRDSEDIYLVVSEDSASLTK